MKRIAAQRLKQEAKRFEDIGSFIQCLESQNVLSLLFDAIYAACNNEKQTVLLSSKEREGIYS